MTYSPSRGRRSPHSAQAYAKIGLETQVLSASPEHLITLLFDGARTSVAKAKLYLQNKNIEGRGLAISKAIDIVDSGLKASIDMEAGGELAQNLTATYELIIRNLLLANLNADMEKLNLAERLLTDLGDAWRISVDPLKSDAAAV
ncbi:MAG TPA: flagellar export chaperone FliS [Eoetvoesiella sp.]